MDYKLVPKPEARCIVCGITANYHPVIVHVDAKVCVGCYKDEDIIKIPLVPGVENAD